MSRKASLLERLEAAGRVHLDARVLALHLLDHPRYRDLTRLVLEGVRAGRIAGQTSSVSLYQLLAQPYREGREEQAERVATLLTAFRGLSLLSVDAAVARQAARVRARLGGRPERAFQLATALESGAELFLTQGSGLRRVAGMEVLDLEDFAPVGPEPAGG